MVDNGFVFPDDLDFWKIYDRISKDEDVSTWDLASLIYYFIESNYNNLNEEDRMNVDFKRLKSKLLNCISDFFNELYNMFGEKSKIKEECFYKWFKETGSVIVQKYDFEYSVLIFLKDILYFNLLDYCRVSKECDFTYVEGNGYLLNADVPLETVFILKESVHNYNIAVNNKIKDNDFEQIKYLMKCTKEFNTNISHSPDGLNKIKQDLLQINLI